MTSIAATFPSRRKVMKEDSRVGTYLYHSDEYSLLVCNIPPIISYMHFMKSDPFIHHEISSDKVQWQQWNAEPKWLN